MNDDLTQSIGTTSMRSASLRDSRSGSRKKMVVGRPATSRISRPGGRTARWRYCGNTAQKQYNFIRDPQAILAIGRSSPCWFPTTVMTPGAWSQIMPHCMRGRSGWNSTKSSAGGWTWISLPRPSALSGCSEPICRAASGNFASKQGVAT